MGIRDKAKKLIYGAKYSSESYINYLRSIGVTIGEDCTIYVPSKTLVDTQYPWMIKIGNHVRITEGVKILTHDYSWSVLKLAESSRGGVLGASGHVDIGNNVFIGMNAIITRNVSIGDNVIIGVGSVVTKNLESNGVYAGNPARKIMSIEDFYAKRLKMQVEEAKELALRYYEKFKRKPNVEVFHEYFMLFTNEEDIQHNQVFKEKIKLCGNPNDAPIYLKAHPPIFNGYEEFLSHCFDEQR